MTSTFLFRTSKALLISSGFFLLACGGVDTAKDAVNAGADSVAEATEAVVEGAANAAGISEIDAVTGYLDPVCEMKISKDADIRYTHDKVTYGFCSSHCKEAFAKEPSTYLAALEE